MGFWTLFEGEPIVFNVEVGEVVACDDNGHGMDGGPLLVHNEFAVLVLNGLHHDRAGAVGW